MNYDDDSKWSLSRRTHVKFQPPATPVSHSAWSAAVRNSPILIVHLTARSSDRCRIEIEQRAELNFFERLSARRRRRRGGSSLFHSFFFCCRTDEQPDISKLLPFVSRKNRIKTRACFFLRVCFYRVRAHLFGCVKCP